LRPVGSVSVLLGNGDGTFQAPLTLRTGERAVSVAAGDFNGDGVPDLAVANNGEPTFGHRGNVSVLVGNGDGTFRAPSTVVTANTPTAVVVGDFNGDGKPDLAVANVNSNNVSVLLGNGDGTFEAARNFGAGVRPEFLAVGDFKGDGKPDLAVANMDSNDVSVLLNNTHRPHPPCHGHGLRCPGEP